MTNAPGKIPTVPLLLRKTVLASGSPRRQELLRDAGVPFDVIPSASVDETYLPGQESPAEHVQRLAREKAQEIVQRLSKDGTLPLVAVIGCDTVAVCDGDVLGKPRDESDARRMLEKLSGREHQVLSGLCVWPLPENRPAVRLASTTLKMDILSPDQLDDYLASGQWSGKAGAFGYQDRTGWLHIVAGSASNVVGLPLEMLAEMLAAVP